MMKFSSSTREKSVKPTCGLCRYYKAFEHDEEPVAGDEEEEEDDPEAVTGICRRYPPALFPGIVSTSAWPEVSARTGWCGEFTPEG